MRVIFVLSEYSLHNQLVSSYCRARPNDAVALIKVPLVVKGLGRVSTARKILPKLSRRFVIAKLFECAIVLSITILPKLLGRGAIFQRLSRIAKLHNLPFLISDNVMNAETLDFMRTFKPDLIVTLFHQIVKEECISIPRLGVVNIHPGILPQFRGIQPYFWELATGFGSAGASLHFIEDASIDTGSVIASTLYHTWPGMSVQLNYYLTIKSAIEILPHCVAAFESGKISATAPTQGEGQYYSWPDSTATTQLFNRGFRIFSFRDLFGILVGKYDDFKADCSFGMDC